METIERKMPINSLMKRQRGLSKVPSPAHIQVDASLPR